jgi:hypothetical protein
MGEGIGLLAFGLFVVAIGFGACHEHRTWERFKADHKCTVIREEMGGTAWSSDGKVISLPSKTTWRCDDGKEYTR